MDDRKTRKQGEPALLAIRMDPGVRESLSIEEIALAVNQHLDGRFDAYVHRYATDAKQQQIQLSSFHESKEGKPFRVMTEYHEALTLVDLASEADVLDDSDVTTIH